MGEKLSFTKSGYLCIKFQGILFANLDSHDKGYHILYAP